MELKPGHKQTGWEVKRLDELGTWKGGMTPSMQNPSYWRDGSVPWISSGDVKSVLLTETGFSVTDSALKQGKTTLLPANSIVLVTRSGILRKYLPVAMNVIPMAINQDIKALIPAEKFSSSYLLQALIGNGDRILARCLKAGTTVESIEFPWLKAFTIPVPPLPEQRAIAEALSDVDALIGELDQIIAKKRDLKQAAMQQLLTGQTRLPGFSGEWESVQFSDIADKSIPWSIGGGPFGSNLKASDYTDEGVRIIQLQNIGEGRFHDDYAIYTSEAKADELLSNNIYPGEIILSKMGDPVARACFVPIVDRRYLMASDGIRLAVDSRRFNKRFVHDFINSVYFRKKAIEASTGSTRQRIGLVDLKKLSFIVPTLSEQTTIAEVLSDMDLELAALEQRRDKTRALKQGMMQELLTGRIRLFISASSKEISQRSGLSQSRNTRHNWAFNEAVVIAALANKFGSREYPLGRLRYTKLAYLMHRYVEGTPEGYLKKAAGPYNPATRYKGPEGIAQKNGYVRAGRSRTLSGFVSGQNINQALVYFLKWYGSEVLEWLEQFRYEKNEALELLATVDMAILDLRAAGKKITVENVKEVLRVDPEWKPKLRREVFSDANIKRAIAKCQDVFGLDSQKH